MWEGGLAPLFDFRTEIAPEFAQIPGLGVTLGHALCQGLVMLH
jgi:hypothetical protein